MSVSAPARIRVDLAHSAAPDRSYDVLVGPGVLGSIDSHFRSLFPRAQRTLVVIDSGVPDALQATLVGALASIGVGASTLAITPSEETKSLATVETILSAALEHRLERSEPVIALSGGILGDMAGFAAAIYRRGVPLIQCPTTLLSMVDASVGGKTGVNLRMGGPAGSLRKNMAGAFWQPRLVLCDIRALASLDPRNFSCGLAECVKHAIIAGDWGDAELLDWTEGHAGEFSGRDPALLTELVSRNVVVKSRIVEADEREELDAENGGTGGRMSLNLGHTVGHALEAWASERGVDLEHGEAVALGLVAETAASVSAGIAPRALSARLESLIRACGLPTHLPRGADAQVSRLLRFMLDDKKVAGGKLRTVLPSAPGHARLVIDLPESAMKAGLLAIGASDK